ncbi:MAG: thiamine-phosphate synthase family protein, partial [Rhabdochlamydiaceae bacterium]
EISTLAEKFRVYDNIKKAIEILESDGPNVTDLIPESRSNIGMALEGAKTYDDVIAVSGRITSLYGKRVKAAAGPEFGASRHVANMILASLRYDKTIRSAMNIRYDPKVLDACNKLGLITASYDRKLEPTETKNKEGATTFWGAEQAILKSKRFPDVIYHLGDFGKEPMVVLLGNDAVSVAETALKIAKIMSGESSLHRKPKL